MDSRGKDDPDRCAGAAILCSELINRQIKNRYTPVYLFFYAYLGGLFFVFADFFQLGLQNGQLFLGQVVAESQQNRQ